MTKSRRRRHGDFMGRGLAVLALGAMAGSANSACPPGAGDGTILRKDALALAYRPLLNPGSGPAAKQVPMARHFVLEVQLCSAAAATAHLAKVDASMPEHRHGMNYRPVITPLGDGRYRVEGMMFHMAGRWEVAFEVRSGKEVTRLTHDMQIE